MPRFLLLALLFVTGHLFAQSTEAALQARLLHQPLFLRGGWHDNKLKFDGSGQLIGSSRPLPFTLSGMDVREVKLDDKGLTLEGYRVGLEFHDDQPRREDIDREPIRLHIDRPTDGDYTHALEQIFATLSELVPAMPSYWKAFADEHFLMAKANADDKTVIPKDDPEINHHVGGGVSPPRVLFQPTPRYSRQAKDERLSGVVLVYLQVDEQGAVSNIRLLHPVGFGLDDMAVDAVSKYKFAPAQEDGRPVRIEMHVEVNFLMFH